LRLIAEDPKEAATGFLTGSFFLDFVMSSVAIRLIVDGYLTLKDRTSLEELREHRQRLRRQLDSQKGPFDVSRTIQILDEDIEVIESGINQL
jgi:hypothetical protein